MPPSRFSQVSRYRNAVLSQSKAQERYSELSLSSTADSGGGKLLAVTAVSSHIFARSSNSPSALITLAEDGTGKYGKQPPVLSNASSGPIGDFDVCPFQHDPHRVLLAAASLQGDISLQEVKLPATQQQDSHDASKSAGLPAQAPSSASMLKSPAGKGINMLSFHPSCPSLFLTASGQDDMLQVWDSNASSPVLHWQGGSSHWDAQWSPDGSQLAACGKDTVVRLWDPRRTESSAVSIHAHASKVKPSKVTYIKYSLPHLLLTTGFSQMRQREISIWDQRKATSPLKRITLDVASSGLEPVCDLDRGMVYMVAKGESTVRWVDVGSEDQGGAFAEGAHALDFAATSAALGPAARCNPGVGEIARLFIASTPASSTGGASAADSIIPASVRVPRRTYIDFHADLYPDTPDRKGPGLSADQWLKGTDIGSLPLMSLDPAARSQAVERVAISETKEVSATVSTSSATNASPQATKAGQAPNGTAMARAGPLSSASADSPRPTPTQTTPSAGIVAAAVPTPEGHPTASPTPAAHAPSAPPSHWSRRFLAGTTPLIAAFQSLGSLDISRPPAARMIAVSPRFFFIPLSGPGGRLSVHPLDKQGRLPLQMPSFQHGAGLGDFVLDPFDAGQIITSAADGVIRRWRVPSLPEDGQEWPASLSEQPVSIVALPTSEGSNKVGELCPHPHADGLLAVIPADADGKIHLIDLNRQVVVRSIGVPAQGLYSAVWSGDGSVLACAGKDRDLYILDIRNRRPDAQTLGQASAHDSPRPFGIVWIDDEHLLTVGHTTGSLRQMKLFRIDYSSSRVLVEIAKQNLDVSPSILFPFWDADTNILWLWSKGERLVSSYEVQPSNAKEPFLPLPAFQHAQPQLGLAFLPKICVNVREVEVDCSVRLCKEELQRVGWKITRSRPEFFQDDVYPPTAIVEQPLLGADEWVAGHDARQVPRKSLQPEGMVPLSQAPAIVRTAKLAKGPTEREKTDKEREDEMFSNIFEKAKGNDVDKDPNHNEEQAARAPDEDDWGDD